MKWISSFYLQFRMTLSTAVKTFISEKNLRYSASLSYLTIFSLAPLLIITISLCGYFFGQQAMEGKIYTELRTQIGEVAATQIEQTIRQVVTAQGSFLATVLGGIAFLLGILGVYSDLQLSINRIWMLKARPKQNFRKYLIKRIISFVLFCGIGFILVLSLILNWLIAIFGNYLEPYFAEAGVYMVFAIDRILVIAMVSTLLTFMFKYLPDGTVKWSDAVKGAVFTSVLFMLGKAGIGYYLVHSNVASMYGAAGSLVILLLWIYYTSIIIYFGATFTKVYAYLYGGKILPASYALFFNINEIQPD